MGDFRQDYYPNASTPQPPAWFVERLNDYGGYTLRNIPKLRVVWTEALRNVHGGYKYPDPDNGRATVACWALETFVEGNFFGDPNEWNTEVLGAFPYNGMYVLRTFLQPEHYKSPMTLSEATLTAIKRKQYLDMKWAEQDPKARLEDLNWRYAMQQKARDEEGEKEADEHFDQWIRDEANDHTEDRVFSFPAALDVPVKQGKMPIIN